jgi:mxaD protein
MKKFLMMLSVMVLGFTSQAQAGAMLHVKKSVTINAPADKVWGKVADFGDLGAWHPAVAKTEIVEGVDNVKGAKRVLTLQDGGKINETLTAYNAKKRTMSYIITESVLPVDAYSATITVKSAGMGKSVVSWTANFKAKAPADDKTATDTINGVFDGGLGNLKKTQEAM